MTEFGTFKTACTHFKISPAMCSRVLKAEPRARRPDGSIDLDIFERALQAHKSNPASIAQSPIRPSRALGRARGAAEPPSSLELREGQATTGHSSALDDTDPAERMTALRIRKAEAEANRAELKAKEAAGVLVSRDAVTAAGSRIMTDVRLRLEAIPGRLGPTLAGMSGDRITDAIETEIKAVLAELARIEAVAG